MSTTKPEALRLAEGLESIFISEEIHATKAQKIAAELRRQHARIADLESQLASIGAGGVSPLKGEAGDAAPVVAQETLAEIALIEKAVQRVGIKSLLNHGAGSLVYSEGVQGVTQSDLVAYTREIALHCAVALAADPSSAKGVAHG